MSSKVEDVVHYRDHPHYELFMVRDHPFIQNNEKNHIPMIRSLIWRNDTNSVLMLNQRIIPQKFGTVQCFSYQDISKNIKIMTIRGAPAIGAAAAYGMALGAIQFCKNNKSAIATHPIQTFQEQMQSYK